MTTLIPFATAYVAETHLAAFPTAVYAGLQCVCALAFNMVFRTIASQRTDEAFHGRAKARRRQNCIAVAIYAVSTIVAPLLSVGGDLSSAATPVLTLGTTSNVIQVDTINIGMTTASHRSGGTIQGTTGSLMLRNKAGTGPVTTVRRKRGTLMAGT